MLFAVPNRSRPVQRTCISSKKLRSRAKLSIFTPNHWTDTAPFFLTNVYSTLTSPLMSFLFVFSPFYVQFVGKRISHEWLPWQNRTRTQFENRSFAIWVISYLGLSCNLWLDQAKVFLSVQFKALASSLDCNLVPIAAESHWSLITKQYHDPMRRIGNKLSIDQLLAPHSLIIDYANLAMSHKIRPERFAPAILAFGAQPRLPICGYKP